jgi:hypothetical protein
LVHYTTVSSLVVFGEFYNLSFIFNYVNVAHFVDGARYKVGTTAGCVCRVGAVADWDGNAVCRHNYFSYEGGTAKYEKLTC